MMDLALCDYKCKEKGCGAEREIMKLEVYVMLCSKDKRHGLKKSTWRHIKHNFPTKGVNA